MLLVVGLHAEAFAEVEAEARAGQQVVVAGRLLRGAQREPAGAAHLAAVDRQDR